MKVKIEITLTPEEYQELEKKCYNARESIVANARISGVKCNGLLRACTPEKIIAIYQEALGSIDITLDDIVRDLVYESLS